MGLLAASGSVSAPLVVPPSGGADDSPQLQTAVTLCAGTGRELHLTAGTYRLLAPVVIPVLSPLTICGAHGYATRLILDLGGTDYLHAGFYAAAAAPPGYFDSTLTSDTVRDSATVYLDHKPTVGSWLEILKDAGSVAEFFTVVAAAGSSSPYTVTLSKPVRRIYPSGSQAAQVNPPTGLYFHHLAFSVATGKLAGRAIESGGCQEGGASHILVDAAAGATVVEFALAWDIGSDLINVSQVIVRCPSGVTRPKAGISFEVASRFVLRDSIFDNLGEDGGDSGVIVSSPCDGLVDNVQTHNCVNGVLVTSSEVSDTAGSRRIRITDSTFARSRQIVTMGVGAGGCGAGIGAPGVTFERCAFVDNDYSAVYALPSPAGANAEPTRLVDCSSQGNGAAMFAKDCALELFGHTSIDDGINGALDVARLVAVQIDGAATLVARGCSLTRTVDTVWQGVQSIGSGTIELSDHTSTGAATPSAVQVHVLATATASVNLNNARFYGGKFGVFGAGGGASFRVAALVQSGVTTPWSITPPDTAIVLANDPVIP